MDSFESGPVLTAEQMRALEAAAMQSGAVTGLELMERAASGVCDALLARWPARAGAPGRAIVLCGPGNNGGDGYAIARLLHGRGFVVEVFALGTTDALSPDARVNHDLWCGLGSVAPLETAEAALERGQGMVIDAVFGTGLTRAVPDTLVRTLRAACAWDRVAVDVPSLIDTDTGALHGDWPVDAGAAADLTVTFHATKPCHHLPPGRDLCGDVVVVDIGL